MFTDNSGFVTFLSSKRAQQLIGTLVPLNGGVEAELKVFSPNDESLRKSDASKIRSLLRSHASASQSQASASKSKGIVVPAASGGAWSHAASSGSKKSGGLTGEAFPELGGASSSKPASSAPTVIQAKVAAPVPAKKVAVKAAPAPAKVAAAVSAPKKQILQHAIAAPVPSSYGIIGGQKVDVRVVTEQMENRFPVASKTALTLLVCNDTSSSKILQSVSMESPEWKSDVKVETEVGVDDFGQKTDGETIGPQRSLPIHISVSTPQESQVMVIKFSFKMQHKTIRHRVTIVVIEEDEVPLAPIVARPPVAYRPDAIKRQVVRYDPALFSSIRVIERDTFPDEENAFPITEADEARLKLSLDEPLGSPVWPSRENYKSRMHDLLWMEEMEQKRLLRKFDLPKTKIVREFDPRVKDPLFSLEVASLSERRPTIAVGDSIFAWRLESADVEYEGYVMSVKQARVIVAFHPDFFQRVWEADAFFTVRFGSTRYPFLINHRSVDMVDLNVVWPISKASSATAEAAIGVTEAKLHDKRLARNSEQMRAINLGLNRRVKNGENFPLLVFGPFGTGKTQTLVELAHQAFIQRPGSHILICTLSNSAADVVATRLISIPTIAKSPANLIRLYAETRRLEQIRSELQPFTYSDPRTGQFAVPPHLSSYRIVVMTCSNAVRIQHLAKGHFSHIIIDEAAQLLEADVLHPLSIANQNTSIIMAGDPRQLTHRSQSKAVALRTLSLSMMDRLSVLDMYCRFDDARSNIVPVAENWLYLNDNYRSHPAILEYCSHRFYDGRLQSRADLSALPRLGEWAALENPNFPLVYAPCSGVEQVEDDSPSFFNLEEAKTIVLFVQSLLKDPAAARVQQEDIGIITPFYKQNAKIRQMLRIVGLPNVVVSSINDLQGREFQAVFVSTVRSSLKMMQEDAYQGQGFINNPQALNTVISRARSLVMIVGHPLPIVHDESLSNYAQACDTSGTLFGRWPTNEEFDMMKAEDESYHMFVTRVGEVQVDKSLFQLPSHHDAAPRPVQRPAPGPIGPPSSSNGFDAAHGLPLAPIAPPANGAKARMANDAPAYQPSSSAPAPGPIGPPGMNAAGGPPPRICLQDLHGKALTMLGDRPLLVKLPEYDAPDAVVMTVEGRFEVHIASLGYIPQVLIARPGVIAVQLSPVEANPAHSVLWTSTQSRPLALEVHKPELATHMNIERSYASIKVIFHRDADITPNSVSTNFVPM